MVLQDFKSYLEEFISTEGTRRTYFYAISGLLRQNKVLSDIEQIKQLDDKQLLDMLNAYISGRKRSYHTHYAFKLFLEFINRSNLYRKLSRINIQARKQATRSLPFSDIKRLVDAAQELDIKLLIMLQYDTASRIGALLGLTNKSISTDEEGQTKITMKEKRGRIKTAYLSEQTILVLNQYLQEKCILTGINEPNRKLFEYNRKDQYHFIWEKIRQLSTNTLGFEISSHWFRHSRAISLFEKGYDIFTISRLLGHASLDSTKAYLESAGIESKKLMEKESPRW